MNLVWGPGNDKLIMDFVFPSPVVMGNITQKGMSKLFSCYNDHYKRYGGRRNETFEEIDTEHLTWKNDGFWLLWGIFKKYIKQNIIMAVLRKTHSHSIAICRLIKINNVKEYRWRKSDSNFDFSQTV